MSDRFTPPELYGFEGECQHKRATHGSPELDEDAKQLIALGADPGPCWCPDCCEFVEIQ